MYYFIDICQHCGQFKQVQLEGVTNDGEALVVCPECSKMHDLHEKYESVVTKEENGILEFGWDEVV